MQEFNALCAFLTLERLESHPDYLHWTVAQGRWTCFSELSRILAPILASDEPDSTQHTQHPETNDAGQGILKTIAMSLAYQTALALDKPFSDSNHEQSAEFNHSLGYISSVCDPSDHNSGTFDDKSTPLLVVQAPLQVKQRFDNATILPRVDPEKVEQLHRLGASSAQSKDSPARKTAVHTTVPSPPRTDTEHHLRVSAVAAPPLHVPVATTDTPQPFLQHSEVYHNNMPQAYVAPAGAVSGPGGYMYLLPQGYPQNPNVFGFMPAGAVPGSFAPQMVPQMAGQHVISQQQMPFPLPIPAPGPQATSSVSDQRLSIDVGEGYPAGQPWNRPQSAQQQVQQQPRRSLGTPNTNAPPSQAAKPAASSSSARNPPGNYDQQAPVEPFTPRAAALSTNYFQPQSAYAYNAVGQPGQPTDYHQGYPAPQSASHVSPYVSHAHQSHVNVAVRSEPTDAHPHGKVPAWTTGQEGPASSSARSHVTPSAQRPNTDVVVAPPAAFTVPVLDEAKVKQMPAALRRKMEADKEAAALAAEERQQESLQAERAASRGRSRSAPRGNSAAAVPVTIVTPATSAAGRPQSAVRGRGGNAAAEHHPSAPSVGRNGSSAAVDVRKSSETAISKFSQQSQPSQGGGGGSVRSGGGTSRIPIAAPLSVQRKDVPSSAEQRPRTAAPSLPAEKVNYAGHVVYESKCPLRCVSVLGGGPARTQFAVGSNAKAIIAMSYARGEIEAQRDVQASVVVDRELAGVHSGSVYCMDYHAGLGLIASGSNDKAIRFCRYDV